MFGPKRLDTELLRIGSLLRMGLLLGPQLLLLLLSWGLIRSPMVSWVGAHFLVNSAVFFVRWEVGKRGDDSDRWIFDNRIGMDPSSSWEVGKVPLSSREADKVSFSSREAGKITLPRWVAGRIPLSSREAGNVSFSSRKSR